MNDFEFKKLKNLIKKFKNIDRFKNIKINNKEDIKYIPIVEREFLENFKIKDCPVNPSTIFNTSGSSGFPLMIYCSKESVNMMTERMNQYFKLININKNEIILNMFSYGNMYNAAITVHEGSKKRNLTIIPLGLNNDKNKIKEIVRSLNPSILFSYPNQLYNIFHIIKKKHNIKKCIAGGELILPEYKKIIESISGTKIYSSYGCTEVGPISVQLNNNKSEEMILSGLFCEIIDKNSNIKEEGQGELLITDLYNYSMPIIRYKVGDYVTIKQIKNHKFVIIHGRIGDMININGNLISKNNIINLITKITKDPNFMIIIKKDIKNYKDKIIILTKKNQLYKKEILKKELINIQIYPDIKQIKNEILKTGSGKYRQLIDLRNKYFKDKRLSF